MQSTDHGSVGQDAETVEQLNESGDLRQLLRPFQVSVCHALVMYSVMQSCTVMTPVLSTGHCHVICDLRTKESSLRPEICDQQMIFCTITMTTQSTLHYYKKSSLLVVCHALIPPQGSSLFVVQLQSSKSRCHPPIKDSPWTFGKLLLPLSCHGKQLEIEIVANCWTSTIFIYFSHQDSESKLDN